MYKKIAVFNHKGGVSKTTSSYHIAWKLTSLGKRVLLVDADSQCNLSILVLGEQGFEDHNKNNPDINLKSGLAPAFKAQTSAMKPMDCLEVKNNNALFLLPGHMDLGEYEVELAFSFLNSFGVMKNLPGAFSNLIEKTAIELNVDYVITDLNPSLSALNQDIIVTSDYFIVPASPDYFSSMAIRSLSSILPKWENWAKAARLNFSDAVYPMPTKIPKFLGYTVNDFSIRNGNPSKAFQEMIDYIDITVRTEFVPRIRNVDMLLEENIYGGSYCLGQIHDFGSLVAKIQEYGLPIFALSDDQIGYTGIILDTAKSNILVFDNSFTTIAEKIIHHSN